MANLRSSLIRLAHTNPELRPALLPLLTSGGEARVASPDEINAYNVRRQMDDALTELEAVERVFKSVEYFLNKEGTGLGDMMDRVNRELGGALARARIVSSSLEDLFE